MRPRLAYVSESVGKVPPQAVDIEQALVGACLLGGGALRNVSGIIEAHQLYHDPTRKVWEVMIELDREGAAIDILTVTQRAAAKGILDEIGGAFFITQLASRVSSGANAEYHARVVQEKYIQRQLITLGLNLAAMDESADVFDVLDMATAMIADVNSIPSGRDPRNAAEIAAEIVDDRKKPVFVSLGMGQLDHHVRLKPKDVMVIGARPSVGKTTFAVNACMNMARAGHKVLFISLEMTERDLVAKITSALTGINAERITLGDIDDADRTRIAAANAEHGVWLPRILVEDLASLKSSQVAGIIHRAVKRHGVEVAVIDYLQCVDGEGDTPVDRMTHISRACKAAAKSSGVRLIELSQLKRRDGAEEAPVMSDLREAGQIEADGDIIVMLGRRKGESVLTAYVEKNKVGPIGTVELAFDLARQQIGHGFAPHASAQFPAKPKTDDGTPF